ncbi:MAG: phosphatidylglycerophosphatase A [Gammaproteobacteria bacterium]|nr:phosphatidylglycerophosphatase A [Gammaproteobacteria bacterium]MDH5778903.1 phosphatidylglycerophosphatase A [Gammaproteobacteria bacterium]
MSSKTIIPAKMLLNPIHFLSLGFGSGLVKVAPGTFGTLAAIPVYLLLANLDAEFYIGITIVLFILGIIFCSYTSKALGVHDHSGIVWDEIVGYLITMTLLPVNWVTICLGFVLFRIFDIWKPWPICVLDSSVHGGLGIMLDDVVAAIYAAMAIQLLLPVIY